MDLDEIMNIPKGEKMYVCTHCRGISPTEKDKNRMRITAGGNLINYSHELTTRTADITTSKCISNPTISTRGARYICSDTKNLYLATPVKYPEYMRITRNLVPQEFIEMYKLQDKIKD